MTKVLIADDQLPLLETWAEILRMHNINVDTAENGADAFGLYQRDPFAYGVVFTDNHMPLMDGLELAERIRETEGSIEGTKPRTYILMASFCSEKDETAIKQRGLVDEFLPKPVEIATLISIVQRELPRYETQ
ncbi:response regulator [Candidatus Woesearchaeota archaeon]|nr:response regulator [Candidatus Woesearchaeota archaeon]